MATTKALVSEAEYLATTYRPDCDYVDGEVVERNLGTYDHSRMQMNLAHFLRSREKALEIRVVPEQRVQVKADRFRIPDLTVIRAGGEREQIIRTPPLLCVEILSPDDRVRDLQVRVDDYLAMGVPTIWVIDPETRRGWVHTTEGAREAKDGVLRSGNPEIAVPLSELFD